MHTRISNKDRDMGKTAGNTLNNNNNTDKWYTHVPKPEYEEGDATVLWIKQYTQTEKLQQIGQI
jgi:hypothetical protein